MGDISGRPKAPSQQIVYVPQPVYQATPSSTTDNGSGSNNNTSTSTPTEQTPAQQREQSLLGRSRSRIGTILTGFRGILAPVETGGQRKTLLGE